MVAPVGTVVEIKELDTTRVVAVPLKMTQVGPFRLDGDSDSVSIEKNNLYVKMSSIIFAASLDY